MSASGSTSGSRGMSNGARHGLGAVVGLVLTPVIGALLVLGTDRLLRVWRLYRVETSDRWVAAALLALAAVLLGLLMGSRMSPLASLVPGAIFTLVNLPWLVAPRWAFRNVPDALPGPYDGAFVNLCSLGILGILGGALLVASIPPSRWRGPAAAGSRPQPQYAPPPGGQWPPPSPQAPQAPQIHQAHQVPGQGPAGAAGPPPFDPNVHPYGPPPPHSAPGEAVPGQFGQPGPAVPQQPSPAAPAPHGSPPPSGPRGDDDDEPGEWTRMYGGKGSQDDRPQP